MTQVVLDTLDISNCWKGFSGNSFWLQDVAERCVSYECSTFVFRPPEPDIHTVQELLGHNDLSTTMNYKHVLRQGGAGTKSPLDCP